MKRSDYTLRGWLMSLVVAAGVICLGLIPPFEVFGLRTERIDALSLLRAECHDIDTEIAEMEVIDNEIARAILDSMLMESPAPENKSKDEELKWSAGKPAKLHKPVKLHSNDIEIDHSNVIAIENFDTLDNGRFDRFIEKLAMGENVRIAVMGDSFVEGDIVTSDLRDILQRTYGGRGVGFVPCDIPFTTVRTSVKRDAKGWNSYSIMKHKSVPESLRDRFFASGYIAEGGAGATVTWRSVDKFATLDSCTKARVLLMARDTSTIELTIINNNDTLTRDMTLAPSERLQHIEIESYINSLKLKVKSGKIICYGASLEGGGGVVIDNFSVRSNNGHAIYNMNKTLCNDADNALHYDLVVLQYGLNIMQPGQRKFTKYQEQLCTMIDYAKAYFPNAAIMVLGVSDRWIKDEESGSYVSIGSVDAMTSHQRAAAESCGATFWNTSAAMERLGGMPTFVANGWAAGDYTHINFAGGRRIAIALADALHQQVYYMLRDNELSEERAREARAERERAIAEHNRALMMQREAIITEIIDMDTLNANIDSAAMAEEMAEEVIEASTEIAELDTIEQVEPDSCHVSSEEADHDIAEAVATTDKDNDDDTDGVE